MHQGTIYLPLVLPFHSTLALFPMLDRPSNHYAILMFQGGHPGSGNHHAAILPDGIHRSAARHGHERPNGLHWGHPDGPRTGAFGPAQLHQTFNTCTVAIVPDKPWIQNIVSSVPSLRWVYNYSKLITPCSIARTQYITYRVPHICATARDDLSYILLK